MSKPYEHIYKHYNDLSGREYEGNGNCKKLDRYVRANKIRASKGKKHFWINEIALYMMMPRLVTVVLPEEYFISLRANLSGKTVKVIHCKIVKKLKALYNFS